MPNTPIFGWPYPASTVAPDVPYDIQQLALAAEYSVQSFNTTPSVRAVHTSPVNLAVSGNYYAIPLNAEVYDANGTHHDNATNNTRLTAGLAGVWLIVGQVSFAINGTGWRKVFLQANGNTQLAVAAAQASSGTASALNVSCLTYLPAGGYVEMIAGQASGGALSTAAGTGETWLAMHFMRA